MSCAVRASASPTEGVVMAAGRGWVWFAIVLTCGLAGFATAQERIPGQPQPKQPDKVKPGAATNPQSGGLPAGAVARLGQTRLRHAAKPTCVVFSPDGKTFVTGGEDGTVRVWSVSTGEQINILQRSVTTVQTIAYTHNGKQLAVNFNDGTIRLFEAEALSKETSIPFPNRTSFTFSSNASLMAAGDASGNL